MDKKLYKSRKNKMLDGVCGGIAEYFDIDPTLVRLGFAFVGLWAGCGLIAYIVAMIVIPRAPIGEAIDSEKATHEGTCEPRNENKI